MSIHTFHTGVFCSLCPEMGEFRLSRMGLPPFYRLYFLLHVYRLTIETLCSRHNNHLTKHAVSFPHDHLHICFFVTLLPHSPFPAICLFAFIIILYFYIVF